ncbi:WD repeat-containing protein 24 [Papilio machaon]|uniref:GATOR2 complex protein WDR24 n=1 Tax=Papilio machaon TaxID=76193 RepID=A0A0N0PFH0_PAPMA|nr:WD repeat-containing protein 24 [Papilio machaon]
MKCFDLRMKEVARTFISNTESIRDVQFSPHQAHTFAAVSENGTVQVWDSRRSERCLQQFTAHSGPVFACDWHPDVPWLATASRDKTIKSERNSNLVKKMENFMCIPSLAINAVVYWYSLHMRELGRGDNRHVSVNSFVSVCALSVDYIVVAIF